MCLLVTSRSKQCGHLSIRCCGPWVPRGEDILIFVFSLCFFPVMPDLCPFLPSLTLLQNSGVRSLPISAADRFLFDSSLCGPCLIPLFHGALPFLLSDIFLRVSSECLRPVRACEIASLILLYSQDVKDLSCPGAVCINLPNANFIRT